MTEDSQAPVELLQLPVCALVDHPEQVEIEPVESTQTTILEVTVARDDVRRLIGRRGRTADAIRVFLTNIGAKEGRQYILEIVEPDNRVTFALDI